MKNSYFIGVDIGGTKISAALVSPSGRILARGKSPTPPKAKPAVILKHVLEIAEEITGAKQLPRAAIAGIGVGVPGIVAPRNKILATPNINLARFPLCEEIKRRWKTRVLAGNDVNLGLLGEQWLGAGRKAKNIVGVFPGTGVGGAVILDGRLWIGADGAAAEFGHMIMDIDGPLCSCGNRGCLEALTGRWAIERDIRQAINNKQHTIITSLLDDPLAPIKSKILKTALKHKDPLTLNIMNQAAQTMGKACISLRHIFNPELLILGGGVIEACGDFMLPVIKRVFKSDPFFKKIDHCDIAISHLGDDAVILGAVAMVKRG
jgi:glucokinase